MSKLDQLRPFEEEQERAEEAYREAIDKCQEILCEMETYPDTVSRAVCLAELKRAIKGLEEGNEFLSQKVRATWTATTKLGLDK